MHFPAKLFASTEETKKKTQTNNNMLQKYQKIVPKWDRGHLLILTLTSDDLEIHIVMNVSSTLTNNTIWFVAALCFIAQA